MGDLYAPLRKKNDEARSEDEEDTYGDREVFALLD